MYNVFRENPGWFGLDVELDGQYTANGVPVVSVSYDYHMDGYWVEFQSYEDWQRAEL